MKIHLGIFALFFFAMTASAQVPSIEPGVPLELAKWRAEHYSDIRYELDLTLEKMAPALKGKLAVEVTVRTEKKGLRTEGGDGKQETGDRKAEGVRGPAVADSSLITRYSSLVSQSSTIPIVLDWRRISGHEKLSKVSNVRINGKQAEYEEVNEHLVFPKGVVEGKNRIELEFESPILTSGSAITRYVDKEDGSEYIYSLFVPSDASTAFPVFDQPDLKARFELSGSFPEGWNLVTNREVGLNPLCLLQIQPPSLPETCRQTARETKPISTYVFAFAAGPFEVFEEPTRGGSAESKVLRTEDQAVLRPEGATDVSPGWSRRRNPGDSGNTIPSRFSGDRISTRSGSDGPSDRVPIRIFVRKSQAHKLLPPQAADAGGAARAPVAPGSHAQVRGLNDPLTANRSPLTSDARAPVEEIFRLNREAIDYLEDYFDYPFPFPKYDVVLIPEFPFGGMEHAGATFLRETSVIFPTEPTANNYISRASVIFHEAAHQWFGDTVTMKWFDDLWLKEGFATFMAYKTMEKVLPEYDPWKVFYQRVKPTAYATDVTKGTVPIYQDIPNLNSAKSAYGAIVYQKAPSFLRQAEFYLGEDKFKKAVRSFLKKNEFANAEWSDLVGAFEKSSGQDLKGWANAWVKRRGLTVLTPQFSQSEIDAGDGKRKLPWFNYSFVASNALDENGLWPISFEILVRFKNGEQRIVGSKITIPDDAYEESRFSLAGGVQASVFHPDTREIAFIFPNYRDYGYGIFLLDEKSRKYILENIRDEKDEFLRAQMWGSLWDSVRFAELAPLDYINLAIANIDVEKDETTISSILGRTDYAYTYYLSEKQQDKVAPKLEALLVEKMYTAPTVGQRITYFRALLGVAKGAKAREALKGLYRQGDGRKETGDREEKSEIRSQELASSKSERVTSTVSDANSPAGATENSPGWSRMRNPGDTGNTIPSRFSGDTDAGGDARGPSVSGSHAQVRGLNDPFTLDAGEVVARQLLEGGHKARPYTGPPFPIRAKDRFDIATRLIIIGDPDGAKFLAELEKTEKDDAALRWAYAAKAGIATKENKARYWKDFTGNKEISESWIEEASGVWNSPSHSELTLPYLDKALAELPNLKRDRKIFFVNNWLGSFIGGQKSEEALKIVNRFLETNPKLDADLRRKILENVDGLERAVKIRSKFGEHRN